MTASLRVRLCGGLALHIGGREVTESLPGRQGRVLLAYLVATAGTPVARDTLIDVVWQGRLPGAPDAALSSLLTGVRRVLGRGALTGRSPLTFKLPADARIDIAEAREAIHAAEDALAGGEAATALAHARAGLTLTANPVLVEMCGPWVEELRSDVAQLRCDLLETATRAALAEDELAAAERSARSLVELEPYRESGYALLMETLAARGNVAEALLSFDQVRVLLRDELGVPPAPALTALHERLLGLPSPAPARTVSLALPLPGVIRRSERRAFVAREEEQRRLRERWAKVGGGHGELVLVTGEPGIGKTRLTARFAAAVHADGGAVAYGRADEDTVVPYQPFVEALGQLVEHVDPVSLDPALAARVAELRPLLPQLAGAPSHPAPTGEDRRHALFEAVVTLLSRVADVRPLLLVLEDLHWADKPTLLLMREIVRRGETAPIMVLVTYNDVEVGPASPLQAVLANLRREHVPERVALSGLDVRATATLAAATAGSLDAGRLHEYTSGNPFFIEETLRAPRLPGSADGVPEGVRELLWLRFERLSEATLGVLTLAAVLGRDFGHDTLEQLAGLPLEDVLVSLEEGVAAGLVVEDEERVGCFSFRHALVRDALYTRPAASRRGLLHVRAGQALERTRASAAEIAHHFYLGRHVGGADRAARFALQAGEAAARAYAYEEASAHFERALESLELAPEPDEALRTEVWLALGAVRWRGGEPRARDAYHAAAHVARRRGDADALVRAALGAGGRFYAPGPPEPAHIDLLEAALEAVDPGDPSRRAGLLGRLAEALPDGERRLRVSDEAVRLARAAGESATLPGALISRHAAHLDARHLQERVALAEEAVVLADQRGLSETAALARHWLVYDLVEAGELELARRCHAELTALAHELQQPLYRHSALAWRVVWAQLAGRFDEAERLAREALCLAERAHAPYARAHFTAQRLVILRDQDRLRELLGDLQRLAQEGPHVLPWQALLGLAYLEAGAPDRAAEIVARTSVPRGFMWLPATAWLAEAAARLRHERAPALLAALEPYAGRLVPASFTGCWGPVDRVLGRSPRN